MRILCNTPLEPIYLFGEVVEQWACCDGGDRLNGSPRSRQEKNENIERFTPQIPKQKTDCSTKLLMIFLFLCTLSSKKIFSLDVGYGAGVVIRVLQILGTDAEKIKLSASSIGK